ncbi:MAG: hypothetical protein GF416_08420 [Candidatus Altiarchaeales archaeon]|nr:hypothetical protein [Candidatus Altiarchaeales archaeon]MBD3417139.1 hypothetical protein [Candidatus Altiarchaeales archaeon]
MVRHIAGIRLDYLMKIMYDVRSSRELESIVGSPIEKHLVFLVDADGNFRINALTPHGEPENRLSEEDTARATEIVTGIVKANYPGTENLPEVR